MTRKVEFDIALSYAGEDREYVEQVAHLLKSKGISVFYDKFEEVNLWGKNMYDYLSDIYRNKALYTIMFISDNYNKKLWTNHERQAMQSRAFQENQEYILPARFDETEIPGILPTIVYIPIKHKSPENFTEIICKKLILSGRTVPSENVRKSLSPLVKVPKVDPKSFSVAVKNENGNAIIGATLLLIADNNTFLKQMSNETGISTFQIHTRRNYKLFFADSNYPSFILDKIDPVNDVELVIHSADNVGSAICESGTGSIPGLKGGLNPILDTSKRTYLYAHNIAINGGQQQPVTFSVNVPFDLEDCEGMIMQVTVKDIQGSSSLIEYVKPIIE
jgi:hypothetical protein